MSRQTTTKPSYRAALALTLGLFSAPALAAFVGPPETFQAQTVGAFPVGWTDIQSFVPTIPLPTATVVNTIDAFGNPTRALATADVIGLSKGIIRTIAPSSFYSTRADIRIDRYSDFDPTKTVAECGCPPGTEPILDWAIQAGFGRLQGYPGTDPAHAPGVGLVAGIRDKSWFIFAATEGVLAVLDLGIPANEGVWYHTELDLDAISASLHTRISNAATGAVLDDRYTDLSQYGTWNPALDGLFDIETYYAGELTARVTANQTTIDNIDVPEPGSMMLLASALVLAAGISARLRLRS